ncbi:hypothetical protein C8F04DRAFT_87802 [Mycena alexandri]|uniref:Uncharacterized protein n=1 Tax=Mycena alexandri TaxID=1745969 RepID=A0AAD6SIE7_9AGAR|nr:hypothetical protein C8F04DRAFT_87802 [Mycena alexandri]
MLSWFLAIVPLFPRISNLPPSTFKAPDALDYSKPPPPPLLARSTILPPTRRAARSRLPRALDSSLPAPLALAMPTSQSPSNTAFYGVCSILYVIPTAINAARTTHGFRSARAARLSVCKAIHRYGGSYGRCPACVYGAHAIFVGGSADAGTYGGVRQLRDGAHARGSIRSVSWTPIVLVFFVLRARRVIPPHRLCVLA